MTLAPTLMVQGTASSVGKSLLVAALCRYFARKGLRVAPFKAQNMALNSAVTPDGLEIGRAQAVQALAAGLPACVEMNPILLKPEADSRAQVVVMGKPLGSAEASEYFARRIQLRDVIADSLASLRARHDLVVIEGAGSPAEINLKASDLVNMHVARLADAPVLLAGDIDRGGVFAAFVGTLALLEPEEQARVAAFVINKFRGDLGLLAPGLSMLTQRTHKPVLGVVPYLRDLRIADEDSVALDSKRSAPGEGSCIDVAMVRLPHISNFDDVLPLEAEPHVEVRFVRRPEEVGDADLVILPGTKSTIADLAWLRATGFEALLSRRAEAGLPLLGICGGCQMLGGELDDPAQVESPTPHARGLGLLPLRTRFGTTKRTARVLARSAAPSFLTSHARELPLSGYEIHMGAVERLPDASAAFEIVSRNGQAEQGLDGACNAGGNVVGTLIHGLFENSELRAGVLLALSRLRGRPLLAGAAPSLEGELDRLEKAVRDALDLELLWRIVDPQGRLRG